MTSKTLADTLAEMARQFPDNGRSPAPSGSCRARQYGDQMHCGYCGLQCDTNDPDPPMCKLEGRPMRSSGGPAN